MLMPTDQIFNIGDDAFLMVHFQHYFYIEHLKINKMYIYFYALVI